MRVSDRAQAKIRDLIERKQPASRTIRLFAEPDPTGSLEIGLSFDGPGPDDFTLPLQGVTLVLDSESYATVGAVFIDYEESGERRGFTFLRDRACETPSFTEY